MKGKIALDHKYYFVSERIKENVDLKIPFLYTDLSGGDPRITDSIFRCPGYYYNIDEVSKKEYDDYQSDEDVFDDNNYGGKLIQLKPEIPSDEEWDYRDSLAFEAMRAYIGKLGIDTKPEVIADKSYLLADAFLRRRIR